MDYKDSNHERRAKRKIMIDDNDYVFAPWQIIYEEYDYEVFKDLLTACPESDFKFYDCPKHIEHWSRPLSWNRAAEMANMRRRVRIQHDLFAKQTCFKSAIEMAKARIELFETIRRTPMLDWLIITEYPQDASAIIPEGIWTNIWIGAHVSTNDDSWRIEEALKLKDKFPVIFMNAFPSGGKLNVDVSGLDWIRIGLQEWDTVAYEERAVLAQMLIKSAGKSGVPCWNQLSFGKSPVWRTDLSKRLRNYTPSDDWHTKQLPTPRVVEAYKDSA